MTTETVRLAVALAESGDRFDAAQRLAAYVGARALIILVDDRAVDAYVPALGFPTLPGGKGWRALLSAVPGRIRRGTVDYPTARTPTAALAHVECGIMLVFIGGDPDSSVIEELRSVIPLLGVALQAEQEALAARGQRRVALDHAREAEALATALDAARTDLEVTLRALEDRTRALEIARARAESAARAKDEFVAILGHELRNPLSPITTALQLLRLKGQFGREHEIIERQVANLIRLVDDLLDVTRLTTGKIVLRKEPVEVAQVAARAIEMVSPLLERKRQVLSVRMASTGLVADADPGRLEQILANLLTNAAKYSDEESKIELAATQHGGDIRISVRDHGIGIARDMLDRVFGLFEQHRQANDRSQGGLGLGLAIVRSLVTLHGGTVQAYSDGEGRGAEFVVQLPGALSAAQPVHDLRHGPQEIVDAAKSPQRVLVVDDNRDALEMLSDALIAVGYEVRTAPDGVIALKVAESFRPDVAVLDIGLPVMDGYELATHLRAIHGLESLPLVAVTGYGQDADRHRTRQAGFDAHVVKPVNLDELRRLLSETCPCTTRGPQ